MGLKQFDSGIGRWLDDDGKVVSNPGRVTDEELIRAYIKCYKAALTDGKDGVPNFTTHNAAKLVKDLGHKMSLSAIRNKIATQRTNFNKHKGDGPYDYRYKTIDEGPRKGQKYMTKTWFPTIKIEQTISASEEERNAMIDKLVDELF